MFYVLTNEFGTLFYYGDNIEIADRTPLLEPREVELNVTSNKFYKEAVSEERKRIFNNEIRILQHEAETMPLLAIRPSILRINGYSKFRLFGVEPVGEFATHGDFVAADKIRVVAELSPALIFGSHELYRSTMTMHTLGYGSEGMREYTIDDEKLKSFESKLIETLIKNDELDAYTEEHLNGEFGKSVLVQLLHRDLVGNGTARRMNWDAPNIGSNVSSLIPTELYALGLAKTYNSVQSTSDVHRSSDKAELLWDLITDVAYNVFDTTFRIA